MSGALAANLHLKPGEEMLACVPGPAISLAQAVCSAGGYLITFKPSAA